MAKQQAGLPMSPNDYIGPAQNVIPVKMIPREPTTNDKKYRVGQVFIIGDNPSSGSEGDIWYLARFDSNGDAIWSRFIGTDDYASTTAPGIIEIATDAEAVAGSSGLLAIVPSNIAPVLAEPPAIGGTTPAAITGTTVTGTAVTATGAISGDSVTAANAVTGDTVTGTTSVTGGTVTGTTSVTGGTVSATTAMTCSTLTASTSVSITSQTENALPVFGASGLVDEVGPLTDGQVLVGSTGSAPTAATITAGTGISVTNGPGSIEIANLGGTPTNYYSSANPVYASAATYTVDSFFLRNSDDDGDISKDTSTTLDVSTTGLNGVAVSSALAGTISASGTAVTGTSTAFLTDFQVGDVIYSTTDSSGRRITVITDDTNLTVESSWTITGGASYRRGGEAPSTHYYAYATTDGSTPGILLSTRSVLTGNTLVDLPSGYTKSRQMKYVLTNDDSSDLIKGVWSGNSFQYLSQYTDVLSGGTQTSATEVDFDSIVPNTSQNVFLRVILQNTVSGAANKQLYLKVGAADDELLIIDAKGMLSGATGFVHEHVSFGLTNTQTLHYRVTGGNSATLGIIEYRISEFV